MARRVNVHSISMLTPHAAKLTVPKGGAALFAVAWGRLGGVRPLLEGNTCRLDS